MSIRSLWLAGPLLLALAACGENPPAAANQENPTTAAADNTAVNERDQSMAAATAMDQGQSPADITITAEIRKAVVADDSLSVNAHNVKIITNAGIVTLRGPVASAAEKTSIEQKAKQVAGVVRVDNMLDIAAAN